MTLAVGGTLNTNTTTNVGYHLCNKQNGCQNIANRKTLIRLLLEKQSDLGLPCLSRHFPKATSVRNFRMFTIYLAAVFCDVNKNCQNKRQWKTVK